MTLIPANFFTSDARANFLRSIALLSTVAIPSTTLAADTAASVPAVVANIGVAKYFDTFRWNSVKTATGYDHSFMVRIPYSAKILGSTGDMQKAIAPLASKTTVEWLGSPDTVPAPPTAGTLERLAYIQAALVADNLANGESCTMNRIIDPVSGRTHLEISGIIKTAGNPFISEVTMQD